MKKQKTCAQKKPDRQRYETPKIETVKISSTYKLASTASGSGSMCG